jgi:hypothetical protein
MFEVLQNFGGLNAAADEIRSACKSEENTGSTSLVQGARATG